MDQEMEAQLVELADIGQIAEFTRSQLAGLGTLAERISRRGISRPDDLEVADFSVFGAQLADNTNAKLQKLFAFISSFCM